MTPDDQQRQFYQEQAEQYGIEAMLFVSDRHVAASIRRARLAGHFGRLAKALEGHADSCQSRSDEFGELVNGYRYWGCNCGHTALKVYFASVGEP